MLQVEPVPALGVEASPAQLLGLFWNLELRSSVLCTHGEWIGLLLTRLIADALVVEDPLDWPKGSTWLLERIDQRQVRGRFLAPLVYWAAEGYAEGLGEHALAGRLPTSSHVRASLAGSWPMDTASFVPLL